MNKEKNGNQSTYFPSPLAGEGARRAGEGCKKRKYLLSNNAPLIRAAAHLPPPRGKALRQVSPDLHGLQRRGFTLIELLVVVLIIGILAAVAVPQYKKAVWRSRTTQLKTAINSVFQAQETYKMANGSYSGNFDELDIDLPLSAPNMTGKVGDDICGFAVYGKDSVRRGKNFQVVLISSGDLANGVGIMGMWTDGPYTCKGIMRSANATGETYCVEMNGFGVAGDFCQKIENGAFKKNGNGTKYYTLP